MYSESVVEEAVLEWFHELNYDVPHGPDIDLDLGVSGSARMRVMVKRILRKHGYPPDMQEKATQTVLEQAELMAGEMAA